MCVCAGTHKLAILPWSIPYTTDWFISRHLTSNHQALVLHTFCSPPLLSAPQTANPVMGFFNVLFDSIKTFWTQHFHSFFNRDPCSLPLLPVFLVMFLHPSLLGLDLQEKRPLANVSAFSSCPDGGLGLSSARIYQAGACTGHSTSSVFGK